MSEEASSLGAGGAEVGGVEAGGAEAGEAEARVEESTPGGYHPGETAAGGGGGGGHEGLGALAISSPAGAHQQIGAPVDPGEVPGDPSAGEVPGVEWGILLEEAAQLGGDVCHLLGEHDSS